jgi:hypothetical protein
LRGGGGGQLVKVAVAVVLHEARAMKAAM